MPKTKTYGDYIVVEIEESNWCGIYRKPQAGEKSNSNYGITVSEVKGWKAACNWAKGLNEIDNPDPKSERTILATELAKLTNLIHGAKVCEPMLFMTLTIKELKMLLEQKRKDFRG